MKKNGFLDIFCKIISVLISIVFVVMLIVTALFYSITNVLKPETLTEIITDIDYSELLSGAVMENMDQPATLSIRPVFLMSSVGKAPVFKVDENNSTGDSSISIIGGADQADDVFGAVTENFSEKEIKMIESFLETDVAKEVLNEYANAVNNALSGKDGKLDKEKIKQIISDNKEDIIAFIEANMAGEQIDTEEFSAEIEKFIDENIDEVIDVLPEPEEIVQEFPTEVIEIINIINSGVILRALLTCDAIVALLIFVLRLWDFAGFLWLGVDGIISGIILAVVYFAMNVFKSVILGLVPMGSTVVSSIFSAITSRLMMSFVLILIVSIAFMIIFSIIKKLRRK